MFQKLVFEILLLVFTIGFTTSLQQCNVQEDCELTECCAKRIFKDEAYCVPYRQLNELCLDGGLDEVLYDNKYDITCPCKPGLTCRKIAISDNRGGFNYAGNPRCRNLTADREESKRRTQYRYNSYAGAGGNPAYTYNSQGYGNGIASANAYGRRR
ncbi:prokineticin domain-containing protein [Caerostris extrusa]|uniref:Prokineticin domain-containing protein n=1 Tax=Caerostris extrusa TaxID=172846 RepID=A0AAV4MS19_CAEEX|nr:prokineticin domain-containing protein [Caerostris extrusa]